MSDEFDAFLAEQLRDPGVAAAYHHTRAVSEAVVAILDELPMSDDGTWHVADCGYDDETCECDCFTLPFRIEAHVRAAIENSHEVGRGR